MSCDAAFARELSRAGQRRNRGRRTSSRIFFQMMRVISSPSSSTTGFFTTILWSEGIVWSAAPFPQIREPARRSKETG